MNFKKSPACFVFITFALFIQAKGFSRYKATSGKYYVSVRGNDANEGTKAFPFKTINKINSLVIKAGDKIFFEGGQTFIGSLKMADVAGDKLHPVVISSYGPGRAVINADSTTAIVLAKTKYINIFNLHLKGAGRKNGNRENGLNINYSNHINIKNVEIDGFQKAGLLVYASAAVNIGSVSAHENGYAGISVEASGGKTETHDIQIWYCRAENNPGDPANKGNHSGNGIIVGHSTHVLIDHCTANNNGWDMPRVGNGPVGIWAYEADRVIIQHCLAYQNKTAKGAEDGGGFDFDGGVTNSIIQYCVSYENQGSGYCLFQYAGATPWHNNTIRYNISENDGAVSASKGGIFVWNSSRDAGQFHDCRIYGNIIYNAKVAAISFAKPNHNKGFRYCRNIFVGKDELLIGKDTLDKSEYMGNDWWSLKSGFNIGGIKQLTEWAVKTGKETANGKLAGLNEYPKFKRPGNTGITSASQLDTYMDYELPAQPGLKKKLKLLQLRSR
ncbi:MAG: right-handed parallel beta-helix repeat-containing protein [Mucilaginibacter sp.]